MKAEKNWTFNLITNESSVEILDDYFENRAASYKVFGALGDKAHANYGTGDIPGVVEMLEGDTRIVNTGGSSEVQKWIHGKYWLSQYGYSNKIAHRLFGSKKPNEA